MYQVLVRENVNAQMDYLLFERIKTKMLTDPTKVYHTPLVPDLARYQVGRLKEIFREMIGENFTNHVTFEDVALAKRIYPQEIEIIRTVYAMRRQGKTDKDVLSYLQSIS
jgi:hypothetical protein